MPVAIPLIGLAGSLIGGAIAGNGAASAGKTIANEGQAVGSSINTATNNAQNAVNGATTNAQSLVGAATTQAQQGMGTAVNGANTNLGNVFSAQTANLNPYLATGQQAAAGLGTAMAPGGALAGQFVAPTAQEAQNTPGFQFQLAQGNLAASRLGAASGQLQSGGTMKSLDQYSQGLASTYYQNAYNNKLNSYQTNYSNTLNSLMAGTNTGLAASGQFNQAAMNFGNTSGSNLINGAGYIGNVGMQGSQYQGNVGMQGQEYSGSIGLQGTQAAGQAYMQGAQGYAAGQAGQAQAYGGMVNGVTGAASQLFTPNVFGSMNNSMYNAGGGTGNGVPMSSLPMPYSISPSIGPPPTVPGYPGG